MRAHRDAIKACAVVAVRFSSCCQSVEGRKPRRAQLPWLLGALAAVMVAGGVAFVAGLSHVAVVQEKAASISGRVQVAEETTALCGRIPGGLPGPGGLCAVVHMGGSPPATAPRTSERGLKPEDPQPDRRDQRSEAGPYTHRGSDSQAPATLDTSSSVEASEETVLELRAFWAPSVRRSPSRVAPQTHPFWGAELSPSTYTPPRRDGLS